MIERKNYFLNQQKKKDVIQIKQGNGNNNDTQQINNNTEEVINIQEIIKFLRQTNPNNIGINMIETEIDGNSLINSILKSLDIDIKYNMHLRKIIANIIKVGNIDKDILQSLNFDNKDALF